MLLCACQRTPGAVEGQWRHILVIATAMAAYGLAVVTEGSGFIAAWVAGLVFGTVLRSATDTPRSAAADPQRDLRDTAGLAEDLGGLLAAVSFVAFGAVLLGPALPHQLSWQIVVYAVASLTVIRMLPVAVALVRSGLRQPTVAYIGWFGPRGLASIVLGLITLEDPLRFWDVLEETSPDLVMLDVEMPHVSGIELCRVVRNDPRWAGMPVLFLTAYTDRDVVRRVFAAGADDYVSKPIVGPELVQESQTTLRALKAEREVKAA